MCFWEPDIEFSMPGCSKHVFLSTYWINHRTGFKYFHILNFEGKTPRVGWSKPMHFMHTFFEKSNRYDADRSWLRTADVDIFITCVNFESCGSWVLASQRMRYDRLSWLYTLRLWFFLWDAHGFKTNMLYLHLLFFFFKCSKPILARCRANIIASKYGCISPTKMSVPKAAGNPILDARHLFILCVYIYIYLFSGI